MQAKLIYTVIIRKPKTVLCEFTESSGNFSQITKRVLEKLNKTNQLKFRVGFTLENYMFYSLLIDNIYYITMSTIVPLTININDFLFAFLFNIHLIVTSTNSAYTLEKAHAFSLGELVDHLSRNMDDFNLNPSDYCEGLAVKAKEIPIEDSLNNVIIQGGKPFAILTKNQIHQDNPSDYEQSEIRDCSMLKMDNKELDQTFLKEELYLNDIDNQKEKKIKKKRNKWVYLSIVGIIIILGIALALIFCLK